MCLHLIYHTELQNFLIAPRICLHSRPTAYGSSPLADCSSSRVEVHHFQLHRRICRRSFTSSLRTV